MNNKTRNVLVALLAALSMGSASGVLAGEAVQSLRGAEVSDNELQPGKYTVEKDSPPIARDYVQQPPLIPHKVEGYEISTNFNKCMDCHAWSKAKQANATKVSLTHFRDQASGAELANISPSRYFCNQCHVPQVDAKPLVGNSFKPVDALAQPGRK